MAAAMIGRRSSCRACSRPCRRGRPPRAEGAGGARPVLDHDRLAELFLQRLRDDAADNVGAAAGSERHDDADRTCGHSCADAPTVLRSSPAAVEAASIVRRVSIGYLPASKADAWTCRRVEALPLVVLSLLLYRVSRAAPTRRRDAAAWHRPLGRPRPVHNLAALTQECPPTRTALPYPAPRAKSRPEAAARPHGQVGNPRARPIDRSTQ